jgi:hypothetical protein
VHEAARGPLSETAERFLLSVLDRVPLEQIEELYLFSPLRQGVLETGLAVVAERAESSERHIVHTARYRAVIKGPERGKWEVDVVAEADAPLVTVETVVRGVQRRSSDDAGTTRYSGAELARALRR